MPGSDRIDSLVSVIVPTYNRAQFIERAIHSILSQTYSNLEIIIVDDASIDDTQHRVEALQQVHPRIRYFRHDTNRGGQAARNTGIQAANGNFIAFLDSDDEWLPQKLYLQMPLFSQKLDSPGAVYCGFKEVSNDGEMLREFIPGFRGDIYQHALAHWVTGSITLVVRRDVLEKINGFTAGVRAYQEWDLCIRLARVCEFDYVPECLAVYHQHTLPTISKDSLGNALGFLDLVKNYQEEILRECGASVMSKHYMNAGRLFILADRLGLARISFLKSLRFSPLNVKAMLYFGMTLLGKKSYEFILSLRHRNG